MAETDVDSVLEQIRTAADPQSFLIELTLDRLTEENAALGELARLAAIPRRLDRHVIAALQEGPPDPDRDNALLGRLVALDLVGSTRPDRPAYNDSVRNLLLAQLREDSAWRPRFEAASIRLIQYFNDRLDRSYERLLDVRHVAKMVGRANSDRLVRISESADRGLVRAAVEALYHALLLDADRGCAYFEWQFNWHEVRGLLSSCRALRTAVEGNLRRLAPDILERRRPWLDYWDGRLHAQRRQEPEAEAAYRAALVGAADDARLRLMALEGLAALLSEGYRLGEALDTAKERLALVRSVGAPGDEYTALFSVGLLEYILGRARAAAQTIDAATDAAERHGGLSEWTFMQGVRALVDLDLNERDVAIRRLVAVLDVARISTDIEPESVGSLMEAFAAALQRDHPRATATALAENAALNRTLAHREGAAAVMRASSLIGGGLLRRAGDALAARSDALDDRLRAEVLIVTAQLQNATGELQTALGTWLAVLDVVGAGAPTPIQEVLALANAADLYTRLGQPQLALEYCERARLSAVRLGHVPWQGIIMVVRARLALDAGQLEEAGSLLADAEPSLTDSPRYLVDHRIAAARLAHRRGRHAEALQRGRDAAAMAYGLGMLDRVAVLGGEMAVAAGDAADWRAAAAAAGRSAGVAQLLAERAAAATEAAEVEADELYAAAMRALHTPKPEGRDNVNEQPFDVAVDNLSECVQREPHHPLYRLGLAYTHLRREAWMAAVAEFDAALQSSPELLRETAVAYRPVDTLLLEGEARLRAQDPEGALQVLRDAAVRAEAMPERLATLELRIGDALVAARRREAAERSYARAEDQAGRAGTAGIRAVALARRGALRAAAGDPDVARALWNLALTAYRGQRVASPYWALLRDCSLLGAVVTVNRSMRQILRELRDEPAYGGSMHVFRSQLRAALPDTWFVKESITLIAPDGAANVIASSEPVEASLNTEEFSRQQGELLSNGFPEYEEQELREEELLGGRRCFVRRFSWHPQDSEPVTQIQLYYVHDGRSFTVTATASTRRFVEIELQLQQVLEELVVEPDAVRPND